MKMNLLCIVLLLAITTPNALAAYCYSVGNATGNPNMNPIYTDDPVFIRSVPNGELYQVGNGQDMIWLLHLWGNNGYDFGYAAGQLIGQQGHDLVKTAFGHFEAQVEQVINGTINVNQTIIPMNIIDRIAKLGLDTVLDLQYEESKPFMDPQIFAEMHGMSDASGVPYDMIRRLHFIGEVTRGACSFYGTWGDATLGGKTLQLRALDWDTSAGLQNWPTVTIYHPLNPSMGVAFANVGWAGWIGTLTGMSSNRLGISEIGISYPSPNFGNETYIGIPFVFLERQILQYGEDLFNALDMILNANRTCRLVLGVGDGRYGQARMIQYSENIVNIFNATDLQPLAPWHPRLNDTVYCGMDWICPHFQYALYTQLNALHGQLTPENSIMNVTAVVRTGELHTAVYDLTDNFLYVANAAGVNETGASAAYDRQFVRFNLTAEYARPQPPNVPVVQV